MARDWFDTGNHGIALGLEYGSLVDAATGGAITADTVKGKVSNLEAWIKTDDWPFTDNSNKLSWSGALVNDGSDSNISAGTSSSKKLKELPPQSIALKFGSTVSGTVALSLTGIEAAGETLSGSRTFTFPARPYHLPAIPGTAIDGVAYYCSGNQNDPAQDSYWANTDWYLETNGVLSIQYANLPGSQTGVNYASAPNSRYRGFIVSKNASGNGAAYTGYYYTAPNAPSAVAAARAAGSTQVNLSWAANGSRYVSVYRLWRSLNGGAYSLLKDVAGLSTTDTVPLGSKANYYVVALTPIGVNQAVSANSAVVGVGKGYNVPNPPGVALVRTGPTTATMTITGNQNTATNDRYTALMSWQIQVNGAAFSGGEAMLPGSTTSRPISGLPVDSQIRVQACFINDAGASAWVQSGYLYTTPDAPTDFVAARSDPASSTVNLSWTDNAGYDANVLLEKLVAGAWAQVATFAAGTVSGTTVLSQAESGTYRLRVVTPDNQYSAYSNEQVVAVAFVTNKAYARVGDAALDYCFVGEQRIRRIVKGVTVLWEDGMALLPPLFKDPNNIGCYLMDTEIFIEVPGEPGLFYVPLTSFLTPSTEGPNYYEIGPLS